MEINRLEKARLYERDCYDFLNTLFEEVTWKSFKHPLDPFDFLCYNDGIVFNVDAKRARGKRIDIQPNQLKCPLFIVKIKKGFILSNLRTLIKRFGYSLYINGKRINLDKLEFQTADNLSTKSDSTNSFFINPSDSGGAVDTKGDRE